MSQDDTTNLPNIEPAPPVDLEAQFAEEAKKIVPWGTGWRYDKSAFPYELKGVMHPVAINNKIAVKKHFAKVMAGGITAPPPGMHPAVMTRGMMDGVMDFYTSKIFATKINREKQKLGGRSTNP